MTATASRPMERSLEDWRPADQLLEGCQVVDLEYRYRYLNDAVLEHSRLPREAMLGRTMMEVFPGIERTEMWTRLERCMRTREPGRMENRFGYPDGDEGWFELRFEPVPQGVLILSLDITDRKRAEEQRRRLTHRLERLAEANQALSGARSLEEITGIVRRAGRELAGSDGATFVLRDGDRCHYVDEDAIGPLWKGQRFPLGTCVSGWVMLHAEAAVIEDIALDERVPIEAYRGTFVRSMVMLPIRSSAEPIGAIGVYWSAKHRAPDDEVRLLQGLADATSVAMENVRILRELVESEQRTTAIYEHLPVPTLLLQETARGYELASLNQAMAAALGGSATAFHGASLAELEDPFPGISAAVTRSVAERDSVRRETTGRFPGDPTPRHLVLSSGFVPDQRVVVHVDDQTDRRRAAERLEVSQRLETVGQLAGGVAHDFNNLVTVILAYADLGRDGLPAGHPVRSDLNEIRDAGLRAAALTRQLLAFGRRQVLAPRVVEPNRVVGELEPMLRRLLPATLEIELQRSPTFGHVRVDPGQLEQILVNLAVNARDAMPEGGRLTIATRSVELDQDYVDQHVAVAPGRYACISVSDTGVGMDAATQARIFEPFFTTKDGRGGTGLGLATVYGIVKQSGGSIWVYSEPGRGTTFKIYLPSVDEGAPPARAVPEPTRHAAGGERILVVEDDDAVRKLAERILESAGYRALVARDGRDALEALEADPEPVDAVLTDVVMPRMSGPELVAALRERDPGMRILYTSGYADDAIVHHGVLTGDAGFIGKPYSSAELLDRLRDLLDRPPDG